MILLLSVAAALIAGLLLRDALDWWQEHRTGDFDGEITTLSWEDPRPLRHFNEGDSE